jgi:hypothetical protein
LQQRVPFQRLRVADPHTQNDDLSRKAYVRPYLQTDIRSEILTSQNRHRQAFAYCEAHHIEPSLFLLAIEAHDEVVQSNDSHHGIVGCDAVHGC